MFILTMSKIAMLVASVASFLSIDGGITKPSFLMKNPWKDVSINMPATHTATPLARTTFGSTTAHCLASICSWSSNPLPQTPFRIAMDCFLEGIVVGIGTDYIARLLFMCVPLLVSTLIFATYATFTAIQGFSLECFMGALFTTFMAGSVFQYDSQYQGMHPFALGACAIVIAQGRSQSCSLHILPSRSETRLRG
mmetsp:Transcript_13953/g.30512  ORF Transcript_13953/g.30512 Transcript_13953/m.30512 type:complete len:195 (-) Transcript_13953:424-1008(-)